MISARAAAVQQALVAKGLPTSTIGNQGVPQYSIAYLPYQVPDTYFYQLNTQLVDFLMVTGIITGCRLDTEDDDGRSVVRFQLQYQRPVFSRPTGKFRRSDIIG